jgi:hypothetical protein
MGRAALRFIEEGLGRLAGFPGKEFKTSVVPGSKLLPVPRVRNRRKRLLHFLCAWLTPQLFPDPSKVLKKSFLACRSVVARFQVSLFAKLLLKLPLSLLIMADILPLGQFHPKYFS